jgi:hypothetical protein
MNELLVLRRAAEPFIPKSGTVTVPLTISATSMRYENKKFLIQVLPLRFESIKPAISAPFFVITHRLIITQPAPSLWYKDQGGKENCIDLPVSLVDDHQRVVKSRRVPLKLMLLYEGGAVCVKQEILKIHGAAVVGETGQSIIRVRIEEVSRSHQKQNFVIQIAPDTQRYPLNNDISPAESTPVDVMSKPRPNPPASHAAPAPAHQTHAPPMGSKKRVKEEAEDPFDFRPSQMQRLGSASLPPSLPAPSHSPQRTLPSSILSVTRFPPSLPP